MQHLHSYPAKRCATAAGILIHQQRVLMIKHKLVGLWLPPGGHIEENELPHQAAEREFWEETSVKVTAISAYPLPQDDASEYLPIPLAVNLHWLNQDRYHHRQNLKLPIPQHLHESNERTCEQHYTFIYLMKPQSVDQPIQPAHNLEEVNGFEWFTLEDLDHIETSSGVRAEVKIAFEQQHLLQ